MRLKRITSILLALMIVCAAVFGMTVTANAGGTITYSYVLKTAAGVNAFDGSIVYPSASLSVNSITMSIAGQYNDANGTVYFNASNASEASDFSNGSSIITIVFNVLGAYNPSDIYGSMEEFYSTALISSGNIPFDYSNVIDGEVVSCGHTDIDTSANSYANTKYSVVYCYNNGEEDVTYTKNVWAHSDNASEIAEQNKPFISNPYFNNYSVTNAALSGTVINAALTGSAVTYEVTLNGLSQGTYSYLDRATVTSPTAKGFFIDGNLLATGTSFSFYVTGNTAVTTADYIDQDISENANLINNALYVNDDPDNAGDALVKMELMASVTSASFSRMGVAFAVESKDQNTVKEAVAQVTSGSAASNRIFVHNSDVDKPNESGQYQFIYAPYISVSNHRVNSNLKLYFYTFLVDTQGNVTVSAEKTINFADVLA